jgi:hypothetical protein
MPRVTEAKSAYDAARYAARCEGRPFGYVVLDVACEVEASQAAEAAGREARQGWPVERARMPQERR